MVTRGQGRPRKKDLGMMRLPLLVKKSGDRASSVRGGSTTPINGTLILDVGE